VEDAAADAAPVKGYRIVDGEHLSFAPPSWDPHADRQLVGLRDDFGLRHSQAALWRYPAGGGNRRHREPVQEEVFCVLEGTLTAYLGEEPERVELGPRSIVVVEAGTPLQLRNESAADVVFFAYGAPAQSSDYSAEKLPDA
jgi:mannose-6-phosphate isomerase-like protein (cupin superfamily)